MPSQVLRIRRTDNQAQDEQILVHVSQNGSKALDLKLIGTEHQQLFHATVKESSVKSLQSSNFSGNLDEWKAVLKSVLLHEKSQTVTMELLQGLETVAAISGNKLTLTIRKNIGGITQRLGSLRLDEDTEREEVSGFEWADTAVANSDSLRTELESLQASVSSQKDDVAKLNQQLDDLVKAKKEHEDSLLQKFASLLNAKKLKIRDQQRLLNGAKIDPEAAREMSSARNGTKRTAGPSGKKKRRAADVPDEPEDDPEEAENEDGQPQEYTPPLSDQETEPETEGEGDFGAPAASTKRPAPAAKEPEPSRVDVDAMPARRELPFSARSKQASKEPTPTPASAEQDEDEDEETEDEL